MPAPSFLKGFQNVMLLKLKQSKASSTVIVKVEFCDKIDEKKDAQVCHFLWQWLDGGLGLAAAPSGVVVGTDIR